MSELEQKAREAAEKCAPECMSRTCFMKMQGSCWGCEDQEKERQRMTTIITDTFASTAVGDGVTSEFELGRIFELERCGRIAEAHMGHGEWCGNTRDDCQSATVKAIVTAIQTPEAARVKSIAEGEKNQNQV